MRIIGVDPGTYNMGVGVVSAAGGDYRLVHLGVLQAERGSPLAERLHCLHTALLNCITEWEPSEMAIEDPFVARNVRSALAVGQAQAIAMLAAATSGIQAYTYAPRQVKQAVTDHGGSSKQQVQQMVGAMLGLERLPEPLDASDALAVAICHINTSRSQEPIFLE